MTLLSLWLACAGPDSDEAPGPSEVVLAEASVERSGPVVCAEPTEREAGWFEAPRQDGTLVDEAQGQSGAALLIEDLDDDGWLDVLIPVDRAENGAVMFWGSPEPDFDRDGETFAIIDGSVAAGASAADVDADGDLDVLIVGWEAPQQLLLNQGGRRFTLANDRFDGAAARKSQSSSWADVDGDGDLDLFVGGYGEIAVIDVLQPTPDCSDHIPARSELWLNDGTGTFTDASDQLPAAVHEGYTFASGWFDLDDDTVPELMLAHDDGLCVPSVIMRRETDGTFTASTEEGFHPGSHDMGMAVGDLNGDLRPDFLLTSWNRVTYLQSSETPVGLRWVDATAARGLSVSTSPIGRPAAPGDQVFGWGTEFGDLDNDGDLDAVAVYGFWDAYPGAGDPRTQLDAAWIQGEDGQFEDRASELGLADEGVGRSVVLADLDRNGALDLVKRPLDRPNLMHLQRCTEAAWVTVQLRDPKGLNPFAVGSRVVVEAGGRQHVRWVTAGSTGLYTGSPLQVHVGLGDVDRIDSIVVRWPDGAESRFEDEVAQQHLTVVRQR
ncbi:MAG: CRTAC1 family protein [Myxococcota bacterium]